MNENNENVGTIYCKSVISLTKIEILKIHATISPSPP